MYNSLQKELEVEHQDDNRRSSHNRSVLLQPCLPREFLGTPFKVLGFLLQLVANGRDMIQLFPAIQNLVNIHAHNGLNLAQIFLQPVIVAGITTSSARISVFSLFPLDYGIVMNKSEWTSSLVDLRTPLFHRIVRQGSDTNESSDICNNHSRSLEIH